MRRFFEDLTVMTMTFAVILFAAWAVYKLNPPTPQDEIIVVAEDDMRD